MTSRIHRLAGLGLVLAVTTGAAACSSGGTSTPSTTTVTTTAQSSASSTDSGSSSASTSAATATGSIATSAAPATPACGTLTAEQAAAQSIGKVPAPDGMTYWRGWQTGPDVATGYDPCASLSSIILMSTGGTASSPSQIMLFHRGEFLGTATKIAYGFTPRITRLSDSVLSVAYPYSRPGDTTAGVSGLATATYSWDEAAQHVVQGGQLPPR